MWPDQRWNSTHEVQASYAKARELFQIENDLVAVAVAELHAERWRLHGSNGEPVHMQPIPATVWVNAGAMFHFDTNTVEIGSSQLRFCRIQRIEILSLDNAIRGLYGRDILVGTAGLTRVRAPHRPRTQDRLRRDHGYVRQAPHFVIIGSGDDWENGSLDL